MKISAASNIEVTGNLVGDDHRMDFDSDSIIHLQELLIGAYSDPETAIIREYSVNALDSHIEAGNTAPIEVGTPTAISPFLIIQDYGTGLNVDDIKRVYSRYGASTKRDTNSQTGCLGIGSKSGLAYADQFTVSSVKDGVRVQVVVGRDDEGAGQMKILEPLETSDPNGTRIMIPAKSINQISSKARELFSFWEPGTVLLDGEQPQPVTAEILADEPVMVPVTLGNVNYDVRINKLLIRSGHEKSKIVMGGVPYPIELRTKGLPYNNSLIAFVGIGNVHFAPSREALKMTETTKAAIEAIKHHFKNVAPVAAAKAVGQSSNHREAIRRMFAWQRLLTDDLRSTTYKFKGESLPLTFELPDKEIFKVVDRNYRNMRDSKRMDSLSYETAIDAIWFYGFGVGEEFTAGKRKKLDIWRNEKNLDARHFILVEKQPVSPYIDPARVFCWSDITAIRVPRIYYGGSMRVSDRIPGSYDIIEAGVERIGVAGDDIDQTNPVYWLDGRIDEDRNTSRTLTYFEPDCTIVALTKNRINKFKRYFPKSERAYDAFDKLGKEWLESLPEEDKRSLGLQDSRDEDFVAKLVENGLQVDDPDLQEAMCLYMRDLTTVKKERKMFNMSFDRFWTPIMTKYPLYNGDYYAARSYVGEKLRHTVLYINAVYAEGNK